MSASFQENDVVRVARLILSSRNFTGTEPVMRPPRIGDQATICAVYNPHDPKSPVVIEMVDQAGGTVWLADFLPDELELVWRAGQ